MNPSNQSQPDLVHAAESQECCSSEWERAYERFETPAEEIAKFERRLRAVGVEAWPRDSQILEICCGRGNGMRAWERLGFHCVEGLDLSAPLLGKYDGPAKCYVGDCRALPFEDASRDVVVVQGGLHHLPELPSDTERTVREIARILKPGGRFLMIEPWLTPFLRFVHFVSRQRIARRLSGKIDAFQTMTENEWQTYQQWLANADVIRALLHRSFTPEICNVGWGKLVFLGRKQPGGPIA